MSETESLEKALKSCRSIKFLSRNFYFLYGASSTRCIAIAGYWKKSFIPYSRPDISNSFSKKKSNKKVCDWSGKSRNQSFGKKVY